MNTISTLNNLIETLKDGQNGFADAAQDVPDADLKSLFLGYSQQRAQFAGELQGLVKSLGEDEPTDSGSLGRAIHRGWIDLKAALSTRDNHAILSECERGEDVAVAAYKKALEQKELPVNVIDIVQTQYATVKATHDHIRNLRDSLVAA